MTNQERKKELTQRLRNDMGVLIKIPEFKSYMARMFFECYILSPSTHIDPEIAKVRQQVQAVMYKYFDELKRLSPNAILEITKIMFDNLK